jgi:hypothetical protein
VVKKTQVEFEEQIAQWRTFILKRRAVDAPDAEELEDHLRSQAADLIAAGLSPDEAFLVAVKRIGSQDELSHEFARVHSGRLWKQLVLSDDSGDESRRSSHREFWVVAALAVLAALAVKAPSLFGLNLTDDPGFYLRNAGLLVLPILTAYFVWKRHLGGRTVGVLTAVFAVGAVFANAYPFEADGATEVLTALHLPILLWLVMGVAYVGGEWRSGQRRMDFIRFTGEWFIYMSLIALGGGVLTALTVGTFNLLDIDATLFTQDWLIPSGAAGAAIVAAWLVEAKRGVIENMAPVLSRVFTPLFTLLLLALLGTTLWRLTDVSLDRDALIVVNALLVFVLGLVVYAVSARNGTERVLLIDRVQFTLVITAWGLDGIVLAAMLARIAEWGLTPNRTAALGVNIIILANLSWTAWVSHVMLHNNCPFARLERWQTSYVPVYAVWAAAVVVVFPPVFGFA